MKKALLALLILMTISIIVFFAYKYFNPKNIVFPSYSKYHDPPSNAQKVFQLSQDYPKTFDSNQKFPWQEIDFKTEPEKYMKVVLDYCLEGNIEANFIGQRNNIRKWYHAPYLHDDGKQNGNGREYINGLTRERATPKFEIHEDQDVELESWAVGMYNEPGGYTLHNVWKKSRTPQPKNANFPEGTASFKLLFTTGTKDKVPFLENSLEWTANIYSCRPRKCGATERQNTTVRLLQIDIAVKDKRAAKTGWVFGTFMYDASQNGKTVWDRMTPVGLSWGDDSKVTSDINKNGAFINMELEESYLNSKLIEKAGNQYNNEAYIRYHGLGGRLNGPVDNPISSCISCHGQAGVTDKGEILPMANFGLTRSNFPPDEFNNYFSDVKPGAFRRTFKSKEYNMTDYSLQVSFGIRNYFEEKNQEHNQKLIDKMNNRNPGMTMTGPEMEEIEGFIESLPMGSRGE